MRKRRLWKRATLSIGVPIGEPGGGLLPRLFERQMWEGSGNGASLSNLIWAPFLDQMMLGAWVWVNLGLLWRTRAPMTWHQSMGHKGPVLRPRCIGTERDQTQLLLCSTPRRHVNRYRRRGHASWTIFSWRWKYYDPSKRRSIFTSRRSVISQKIWIFSNTPVRTSDLTVRVKAATLFKQRTCRMVGT